ncbi:MAG: alpha/beta fold hydrolase [Flavobacteriaceae bacterium]|nr:alpha/beta fold hydrolase [Flavobacteriaceae bacterium]
MDKLLYSNVLGQSGKPLFILHGFLGMGDNWKTLGDRFADEGFQVHLIDLRNHGRSFHDEVFNYEVMAEDIVRYADANSIEQFLIIGHSMGGKVAMKLAVTHPNRVSYLVVADIAPKYYAPHHQDIFYALQQLNFEEIKSRKEAEITLAKYLKDQGVRLFLLKNLYRTAAGMYALRCNLSVLAAHMEQVGESLSETENYTGKTLFIKGEQSNYIMKEDESTIHQFFPKAKISSVSNAGHWLHAENPDEFFKIVLRNVKI